MKKTVKLVGSLFAIAAISLCAMLIINQFIIKSTQKYIYENDIEKKEYDCILVLGCGVDGEQPSLMLSDRLDYGVELYKKGYAEKIIMSGDHGREEYDEVNVMKNYAIEQGVPSEDIFMDHAGFSTYESMYRAKEIFKVKKMLIVTQEYHLYRAVYDARALGIEAYGADGNLRSYYGQNYRDFREILARNKDFIWCIIKPEPKYLGKSIPVWGNGNNTNDK